MKFQKVIEKRRSIRKFLDKDVSKKQIDLIINNGILAPSSKNKQPWNFVVVKGLTKNKIGNMMMDWVEERNAGASLKILGSNAVFKTGLAFREAPVAILIYKEKSDDLVLNDVLAIGACIENMFLTATDLKLGALWLTAITCVEDKVNELLNIEGKQLLSSLLIGYPNEDPNMQTRKTAEEATIEKGEEEKDA